MVTHKEIQICPFPMSLDAVANKNTIFYNLKCDTAVCTAEGTVCPFHKAGALNVHCSHCFIKDI